MASRCCCAVCCAEWTRKILWVIVRCDSVSVQVGVVAQRLGRGLSVLLHVCVGFLWMDFPVTVQRQFRWSRNSKFHVGVNVSVNVFDCLYLHSGTGQPRTSLKRIWFKRWMDRWIDVFLLAFYSDLTVQYWWWMMFLLWKLHHRKRSNVCFMPLTSLCLREELNSGS